IKRGTIRNGRAHEAPVDLDTQSVMTAASRVPLHHEPALTVLLVGLRGRAGGLGGPGRLEGSAEVALGPVPPKLLAASGHNPNLRTPAAPGQGRCVHDLVFIGSWTPISRLR